MWTSGAGKQKPAGSFVLDEARVLHVTLNII